MGRGGGRRRRGSPRCEGFPRRSGLTPARGRRRRARREVAEGQQACHRSPWPEERRRRGNQQLGPLESGEHQQRGLSVKLFLGYAPCALRSHLSDRQVGRWPHLSVPKRPTPRDPIFHGRRNRTAFMARKRPPLLPDGAGAHGVSFSASSDGEIPTPISFCAAIVVKTGNVGEGKRCSGDFFC